MNNRSIIPMYFPALLGFSSFMFHLDNSTFIVIAVPSKLYGEHGDFSLITGASTECVQPLLGRIRKNNP